MKDAGKISKHICKNSMKDPGSGGHTKGQPAVPKHVPRGHKSAKFGTFLVQAEIPKTPREVKFGEKFCSMDRGKHVFQTWKRKNSTFQELI
jgi:hypothetical protein